MTSDDQGDELRRVLDENKRLRAENEQLRLRLGELEARLEAALRAGKRQSAPFSKGEPKTDPKRPGRKSGEKHGRHGHRQPPEHVDETVAVDPPCACPDRDCGGELEEAGIEEQWQEEILPPRPIRRRFVIHVGRCRRCGRRVRGRHPLQTSSATGAAAAQAGCCGWCLATSASASAGTPSACPPHGWWSTLQRQLSALSTCERARCIVQAASAIPSSTLRRPAAAALQQRLTASQKSAFLVSLYVTVSAATPDALEPASERIEAAARSALCQLVPCTFRQLDGRLATLPLGHYRLKRRRVLDTAALTTLCPWFDSDLQEERGLVVGSSRATGQPVLVDPFDDRRYPNAKAFVKTYANCRLRSRSPRRWSATGRTTASHGRSWDI